MNGSAGTRGLWRSLRLVGSTVACGALTWGVTIGTVGAQAASATGSVATYRGVCPTKTKLRQKNARRAEAKTRSRKAHTACRPAVPTGTPPGSTSGGSMGSSPDHSSPDPGSRARRPLRRPSSRASRSSGPTTARTLTRSRSGRWPICNGRTARSRTQRTCLRSCGALPAVHIWRSREQALLPLHSSPGRQHLDTGHGRTL